MRTFVVSVLLLGCVVNRYASRGGRYVLRFYRRDMGYYGNYQPFLGRMGVPKCS